MRSVCGFETPALAGPLPTGRCLILVTPDAQRTMNTCPGASHALDVAAIDEEIVRSAAILYLEGYLCGPERPRAAMLEAVGIAHDAGRQVAFTLSESVCIAAAREGFAAMIDAGGVDLLFANEDEILPADRCEPTSARRLAAMAKRVPTLVITRGAAGAHRRSSRASGSTSLQRPSTTARRHDRRGRPVRRRLSDRRAARGSISSGSLRIGAIAAAEVISHFGARPEADLKAMVAL